jgi:hypothetical protein
MSNFPPKTKIFTFRGRQGIRTKMLEQLRNFDYLACSGPTSYGRDMKVI